MKGSRILIVDDQGVVSEGIRRLLLNSGFEDVRIACSGEEGIEMIRGEGADLVLMDIFLSGGMDGIEAAKLIKGMGRIPVLFLTSDRGGLTFEKAKAAGAEGYLLKDWSLNEQLVLQIEFTLDKYKTEGALRNSEERFRTMAESVRDALITIDWEDRITYWNGGAERIFGYTSAEALGKKLHYMLAPERYMKDFYRGFGRFKKSGEGNAVGRTLVLEAKRRSGELFPVEISLSSMMLDGKWHACGVVRDISERMESQRALLASEEALRKANSTKDKFFSIIAHDLRSPLSSIRSMMELLATSYDTFSSDEVKDWLNEMNNSTRSLTNLLDDLLHWSRANLGKMEFFPDLIDLSGIAATNVNLLKMTAFKKDITLKQSVSAGTYVFGDSNMINMIIRNLLSNAVKFTKQGGTVNINAKSMEDFVDVFVEDNGVGIKAENIDKLFRLDVNFSTIGTNKEKGTGLGLVICKEFVDIHKGKISVESEWGKGSKFVVSLPSKLPE